MASRPSFEMRVSYGVVNREGDDLAPNECRNRKAVEASSVQAVKAAFPDSTVYVWRRSWLPHGGCWDEVDETTQHLVTERAILKVFRDPSKPEQRSNDFQLF